MKISRRGFSLMELMLAAAILLIAILSLLAAFINCLFLNETNRNLVSATNDAQYVLEQIQGLAYDDIPAYSPPVFNNLSNELITLTRTIGSKITEVTVDVSWTERQRNKSLQLSTRFAR